MRHMWSFNAPRLAYAPRFGHRWSSIYYVFSQERRQCLISLEYYVSHARRTHSVISEKDIQVNNINKLPKRPVSCCVPVKTNKQRNYSDVLDFPILATDEIKTAVRFAKSSTFHALDFSVSILNKKEKSSQKVFSLRSFSMLALGLCGSFFNGFSHCFCRIKFVQRSIYYWKEVFARDCADMFVQI